MKRCKLINNKQTKQKLENRFKDKIQEVDGQNINREEKDEKRNKRKSGEITNGGGRRGDEHNKGVGSTA